MARAKSGVTKKKTAARSPALKPPARLKAAGSAAKGKRPRGKAEPEEDSGPPAPAGSTSLVIVESPAKARTIGKYLGRGYRVKATVGHVRDLPEKKLGIDIENGFRPEYVTIAGKEKTLTDLKNAAKDSREIFLATDPDREGEAIAWHVAEQITRRGGRQAPPCAAFTRSPRTPSSARSRRPARSTSAKSRRSRRAACSTGSSATRRAPSSGRRSRRDSRPDACRRSRCG